MTRNSIRLKFVKKNSILNPVQTLPKCYNLGSPRSIKSPSNSVRYNCQNICSRSRRPKTILKIRKKAPFLRRSTNLLFTSFSKTLLTTERRLTGRQFSVVHLSPTFLNTATTDETFQQSGKQDSFRHMLKSSASKNEN